MKYLSLQLRSQLVKYQRKEERKNSQRSLSHLMSFFIGDRCKRKTLGTMEESASHSDFYLPFELNIM